MKNTKLLNCLLIILLAIPTYSFWYNENYFNSLSKEDQETISIINKTNPWVVSIVWKKLSSKQTYNCIMIFNNICLRVQSQESQDNPKSEYVIATQWTGFLVYKNWYIITNKHVIDNDSLKYEVVLSDGKSYPIQSIKTSDKYDIALIKIDWDNLPYLKFWNSNDAMIWQSVLAIWNTLWEYQNTVTKWIISWLNRTLTVSDAANNSTETLSWVMQTSAAISPWNSWWPLIDSIGNVIWINTAVDLWWQNIWFAIPANIIKDFLKNFQNK